MARGSPAPAAAAAASAASATAAAAPAAGAGAGVAGSPTVGAAGPRYPSVSAATVFKLLFFSAAMIVLPIASYFGSRDYLWDGDLFRSAVTAVVVVHIVMFSYVIVAYFEDVGDAKAADADARKRQ